MLASSSVHFELHASIYNTQGIIRCNQLQRCYGVSMVVGWVDDNPSINTHTKLQTELFFFTFDRRIWEVPQVIEPRIGTELTDG